MSRRAWTAALLLAGLKAIPAPAPVGAQASPPARAAATRPDPGAALLAELRDRYHSVAVAPHSHGTMVSVALRVPAGSAADPVGEEGLAHLVARVRERQAAGVLDPHRAALAARVGRSHTTWTLLATPDAWREMLRRVDELLFDTPLATELVEAERLRVLETLRFEAGSPVEAFRLEAAGLLAEPGSPWASPPRGTVVSLEELDPARAEAWRREHVRARDARVALAGPVHPLPETDGAPPAPTPTAGADTARPAAPAPPPLPRVAWRVGDRVRMVQEVTSSWVTVAWPAPDTLSRTALELLAHLLEERLDPVPPDPDRYGVEVTVEDTPGGPVLAVEASILPEALERWEARIVDGLAALAAEPMDDDFFRWRRRRFRTRRLLAEAAPEAEAARMTRDLATLGRSRNLDAAIWRLDAADLLEAARSLGEPRILLLGPDLAQDGPDGA